MKGFKQSFFNNMMFRSFLCIAITGLVAVAAFAQRADLADTSPHTSGFITVKGIKLHYLDWGGSGETLLFLTGAGDTAHVYDRLAPKFTDRFRVLALTRRGFGESDKPETGYDVATLGEDVREFLDALKIKRVNLMGHSAGGNELIYFAGKYPRRTLKLVFLDSAYDRRSVPTIEAKDPLASPPPKASSTPSPREKIENEFFGRMFEFEPDYRRIKAPSLSFYAIFEKHWGLKPDSDEITRKKAQEYIEAEVRPYQLKNIQLFRTQMPKAEIVILHGTDHYFFRDPAKFDEVVEKIRSFLLRGKR